MNVDASRRARSPAAPSALRNTTETPGSAHLDTNCSPGLSAVHHGLHALPKVSLGDRNELVGEWTAAEQFTGEGSEANSLAVAKAVTSLDLLVGNQLGDGNLH
jgi:hypothetical protein